MRRALTLSFVLASSLSSSLARAYDRHATHPWLTRQAAQLLVEQHPGRYDELLEYLDECELGSADEDNFILDGDTDPFTLRVLRHFYRPTDGKGLEYGGRPFPSSYEWAAIPNAGNEWDWGDGLRKYREGDRAGAYETLGHVVHLIQDATVPAHTHLDAHGPPAGDDYEDWVTSRFDDSLATDLPVPAPGTPIPAFSDPWEAWQATAWASYRRNLYPGDLSDHDAPAGVIVDMFPDVHWSWFAEKWTIGAPPVGDLGEDFFEEEPGLFYFKNAEHAAAVDKIGFDPDAAADTFAPGDGSPMVAGFARDLIPIAILHTAAVMKLFLDEAYAQAPEPPPEPEPSAGDAAGGCSTSPRGGLSPFALVALIPLALRRRRS